MASRDIANMHLFLDLKNKFPDLPEDTLRKYTPLYAEDQDKCISLLVRESRNHYNPSQPFADFRLPEIRPALPRRESVPNPSEHSAPSYHSHSQNMTGPTSKPPVPSGRSTSHAGIMHLPRQETGHRQEAQSAPVVADTDRVFGYQYQQFPDPSHAAFHAGSGSRSADRQMIFSTTKEHYIEPPASQDLTADSKKHAVKLTITPLLPYQQQQLNVFNAPVSTAASHSQRLGRHSTTLNFQLQPPAAAQGPMQISSVPCNLGDPSNSRDFASHVQVSIGARGATFTALRVQRPSYHQSSSHQPGPSGNLQNVSPSQDPSPNLRMLSERQVWPGPGPAMPPGFPMEYRRGHMNYPAQYSQYSPLQSFLFSSDYILAVKNHQIAQLDLIWQELEQEKSICSKLKTEVQEMEDQLAQQSTSKISVFNIEELNKLRDENRKLRIECNCLSMEVDMYNNVQIPLGVTDEDFYANIFTGPDGALTSDASKDSNLDPKKLGIVMKNNAFGDEEDDEKNNWNCRKCTYANHPAMEKCEICEMPKTSGSFFDNS